MRGAYGLSPQADILRRFLFLQSWKNQEASLNSSRDSQSCTWSGRGDVGWGSGDTGGSSGALEPRLCRLAHSSPPPLASRYQLAMFSLL